MPESRSEIVGAVVGLVAPYAVWMILMAALPSTASAYAIRTLATAATLGLSFVLLRREKGLNLGWVLPRGKIGRAGLWAFGMGLLVFAFWALPEDYAWYRRFVLFGRGALESTEPSPVDPAVCGWPLTWVRLVGSAFIIAPAEELFFRSFLYRSIQGLDWRKTDPAHFQLTAFLWMVALFAVEHDPRFVVGALAGVAYGFLALRMGLLSAILAHVITNLVLGLYVIETGKWAFW